jgi:hypothetical protein
VRAAAIACSAALLAVGVAVVLVTRDRDAAAASVPAWIRSELPELTVRPAAASDLPVTREFALRAVQRALFLDDAPDDAPAVVPALVGGRFLRGPPAVSPSGEVEVPVQKDVPVWIVGWRGQTSAALERLGAWPDGARVDAIFVVDGVTGDCCFVSRLVPPPDAGG